MDDPNTPQAFVKDVPLSTGLTSAEARRRLKEFGPNAVPDTSLHPLRRALTKFWAPVPWMLEAAIVLEIVLGKYVEAAIIAGLLAFNAVLGFFQEGRAQATLAALKSRLALNASVRRDNVWVIVPATEVVTQASPEASAAANQLEAQGFRVLAVAVGPPQAMKLAGIIALSDLPRTDSAALIAELRGLGVRTVMVTGDAPATAAIVARAVGLEGAVCPPGRIPDAVRPEDFAVFAGVLPEGKYDLVKAFQKSGHTVGMCGDGANDAPALRQAQMGIAVSTATDVAKSAAGIVLTQPGLGGIVASVKEGRVTFQRILTYVLNSLTKKTVQVLFLAVGLVMTGHAILTPMLIRWAKAGKLFYSTMGNRLMEADLALGSTSLQVKSIHPRFAMNLPNVAAPLFDVTPDGEKFVVVTSDRPESSSITLVTNWTALLRKK